MDFNTKVLDNQINLLKAFGDEKRRDLILYYQVRLEYLLLFGLGYLWNKNLAKLDPNSQEYVLSKVIRPSLGDLVDICRKLDLDREIFGIAKIKKSLDNYPKIRNRYLGHGYTFDDRVNELVSELKSFNADITSTDSEQSCILSRNLDLILVTNADSEKCSGIRFLGTEMSYAPWTCSRKVCDFQLNNLYLHKDNYEYFRLSPFINIEMSAHPRTLLYCSIQEKLTGRAKYNQISESEQVFREWPEFCSLGIEIDGVKRKSSNGTIINVFNNNYKKYIPLEIKSKLRKFLLENKAFVCGTVWGHGGVGKTATIQSICDDLANDDQGTRKFDYIVFLTAKDRRLNFETGQIEEILFDERVDSLDGVIQKVNLIIFGENTTKPARILGFEGRLLLVIDDFETFSSKEKNRVEDFIKKLDINHHKVVITTRAKISIGEEFATNELMEDETLGFLRAALPIEFANKIDIERFDRDFRDEKRRKRLYEITSGRPVFIFQFAHLYAAHQHDAEQILKTDIKGSDSAVKFLYERIYEYLSDDAKMVFMILGQLVKSKEDLSHLLGKAKYVLGLEHEGGRFVSAVDELVKLKIIELRDGDIFHIYSQEIWQIMVDYFLEYDGNEKTKWSERLKRVARGGDSVEQALLLDADTSRHSFDESEVATAYQRVLDRPNCALHVKLQAVLNFAEYLFNDIGKKLESLKLFAEYAPSFADEPSFVKTYATYLWSALDIEDLTTSQRNRKSSIKVLTEYFSTERDLSDYLNLELLGMLVIFRTSSLIEKIEELDTKLRYKEIREPLYNLHYQECLDSLKNVYRDGSRLFKSVMAIDTDDGRIPISTLNRALNGLISFVDACERLEHYKPGERVCLYAFENFGDNFSEQFFEKFKKLYASQNKPEHGAVKTYKNRLLKRKAALDKKRNAPTIRVIKLGSIQRLPNGTVQTRPVG
jgi:hypothetical protein